jgi:hypothetical protein
MPVQMSFTIFPSAVRMAAIPTRVIVAPA